MFVVLITDLFFEEFVLGYGARANYDCLHNKIIN